MTDDKFNKDGMPICRLYLPNIHYRGDLANHVLPLWEKAGIGYDCYSVGSGGTMMMLADPSWFKEAEHIALIARLQLERRFNDFGPDDQQIAGLCGRAWRPFGRLRHQGIEPLPW